MSQIKITFDDAYYESCPWDINDDAKLIQSVAKEAGRIALSYFQKTDLHQWNKSNDTPVCEGDLAVDEFLRTTLIQNRPGYGWLSEETEDHAERMRCGRLWIVDPIDGTRAFINGGDDWCVSIALIEDMKPILGVIYVPISDNFYFARVGDGAYLNGQKITVSGKEHIENAHMMGNATDFQSKKIWPQPWPSTMETTSANSIALRIALVASGFADMCVTLRPKNDWDIAAADLIIHEAGGKLTTGDGRNLIYNRAKPLHDHIIATTPKLYDSIMLRVLPALKMWHNA
jgi:myo-inositol-1(or 4)-monophosphatase